MRVLYSTSVLAKVGKKNVHQESTIVKTASGTSLKEGIWALGQRSARPYLVGGRGLSKCRDGKVMCVQTTAAAGWKDVRTLAQTERNLGPTVDVVRLTEDWKGRIWSGT